MKFLILPFVLCGLVFSTFFQLKYDNPSQVTPQNVTKRLVNLSAKVMGYDWENMKAYEAQEGDANVEMTKKFGVNVVLSVFPLITIVKDHALIFAVKLYKVTCYIRNFLDGSDRTIPDDLLSQHDDYVDLYKYLLRENLALGASLQTWNTDDDVKSLLSELQYILSISLRWINTEISTAKCLVYKNFAEAYEKQLLFEDVAKAVVEVNWSLEILSCIANYKEGTSFVTAFLAGDTRKKLKLFTDSTNSFGISVIARRNPDLFQLDAQFAIQILCQGRWITTVQQSVISDGKTALLPCFQLPRYKSIVRHFYHGESMVHAAECQIRRAVENLLDSITHMRGHKLAPLLKVVYLHCELVNGLCLKEELALRIWSMSKIFIFGALKTLEFCIGEDQTPISIADLAALKPNVAGCSRLSSVLTELDKYPMQIYVIDKDASKTLQDFIEDLVIFESYLQEYFSDVNKVIVEPKFFQKHWLIELSEYSEICKANNIDSHFLLIEIAHRILKSIVNEEMPTVSEADRVIIIDLLRVNSISRNPGLRVKLEKLLTDLDKKLDDLDSIPKMNRKRKAKPVNSKNNFVSNARKSKNETNKVGQSNASASMITVQKGTNLDISKGPVPDTKISLKIGNSTVVTPQVKSEKAENITTSTTKICSSPLLPVSALNQRQVLEVVVPCIEPKSVMKMLSFDDIPLCKTIDPRDIAYAYLLIGTRIYEKCIKKVASEYHIHHVFKRGAQEFESEIFYRYLDDSEGVENTLQKLGIGNIETFRTNVSYYKRRISVSHMYVPATKQSKTGLVQFFVTMLKPHDTEKILERLEPIIGDVESLDMPIATFKDPNRPLSLPSQSEIDSKLSILALFELHSREFRLSESHSWFVDLRNTYGHPTAPDSLLSVYTDYVFKNTPQYEFFKSLIE